MRYALWSLDVILKSSTLPHHKDVTRWEGYGEIHFYWAKNHSGKCSTNFESLVRFGLVVRTRDSAGYNSQVDLPEKYPPDAPCWRYRKKIPISFTYTAVSKCLAQYVSGILPENITYSPTWRCPLSGPQKGGISNLWTIYGTYPVTSKGLF